MSLEVSGRVVRLSMPDFEALVAQETVPEELAGLDGGHEGLAAVRDPLLVLQCDVVVPAGGRSQMGWVGAEALTLMLPLRGDRWQLMVLPVDQLAVSLARIVGLGPGTRADRAPYTEAVDPFVELGSGNDDVRREALAHRGWDVAWRLGVRSEAEEWLMAAGAGPEGSWLVEPDAEEGPFRVLPVSATTLYRRFTAVLPGLLGG